MKKLLRAILGWLDRKFPDRVEVNLAEYLTLKAQIETASKLLRAGDEWAKKTDERMTRIETEINKLNVAAGYGAITDKFKMGTFQR